MYEPAGSGAGDKAYLSKGVDASTHSEGCGEDILDSYRRITGKGFDEKAPDPSE